jgi:hypothetical protein
MHSGNRFEAFSRGHRYGKVYNRNLLKWYKREPDSRLGVPSAAVITSEFVRETELTRTVLGTRGLTPIVIDHPVSSITQAEIECRVAQIATQAPAVWLSAPA